MPREQADTYVNLLRTGMSKMPDFVVEEAIERAAILFEKLCIPGENTFPDDPIMDRSEMDDLTASWSVIRSVMRQALEGGTPHHDPAEFIFTCLYITAQYLEDLPLADPKVQAFMAANCLEMPPKEFLATFDDSR